MRTLRIVTNNSTYGFRGHLFRKFRNPSDNSSVIDHEIENDDFAQELLDVEDSPFREVDENGEIITNGADKAKAQAERKSAARRTVDSPSAIAAKAAQSGRGDISLGDLTPAKDPLDHDGDGKKGGAAPAVDAKKTTMTFGGAKKATAAGKGAKAKNAKSAAPAAPAADPAPAEAEKAAEAPAKDDSTEGAVQA